MRILLDRQFPTVDLGDGLILNGIRGYWTAERGYYIRFKLLVPLPGGGQLNITNCLLEALEGGVLRWTTPRYATGRILESDVVAYERVLNGLRSQSWISLIGSSRLRGRDIKLPTNDPLAKALEAASRAL